MSEEFAKKKGIRWNPEKIRRRRMEEILKDEIDRLRSIMAAAANEIEAHWEAHCDADGFGPVNLVRRLRTGKGDYRSARENEG